MIKVLFVCLGNICRSPMAEFLFKDMVKKRGLQDEFYIESAATSNEEEGSTVYYKAKEKLAEIGISTCGKTARKLTQNDYGKFDYILGMEQRNIKNIIEIVGEDKENKVADPWYTGNFDITYNDIIEGLEAFLKYLKDNNKIYE